MEKTSQDKREKKVYIRRADGIIEREVFVLSLIEHKSDIDYDVAMQLLRYMCVIWQEYKTTQNKIREGSSRRKNFRYPLIIPIVYYEGKRKWTADLNLKDRIDFSEGKTFQNSGRFLKKWWNPFTEMHRTR